MDCFGRGSNGIRLEHGADPEDDTRVICLDIDQCSIFGDDTFDILRVLRLVGQLRGEPYSSDVLLQIGKHLVNPAMIEAVGRINRLFPHILVLFYTAKAAIVERLALHENEALAPLFIDEHNVYFHPATGPTINHMYLYNQAEGCYAAKGEPLPPSKQEVFAADLERLGLVTWAASLALGLPYAAAVYITAECNKNLNKITSLLNVPFSRTWLFDDKAQEHAAPRPPIEMHMIPVQPFDYSLIPLPRAKALNELLEHHAPLHVLDQSTILQLTQATPAYPESHLSFRAEEGEAVWNVAGNAQKYGIDHAMVQPWDIAPILSCSRNSMKKKQK